LIEHATSVALITGGAKRIGASIARHLHHSGMDIAIHYRGSQDEAEAVKQSLEAQRPNSVILIQADLESPQAPQQIYAQLTQWRSRLDVLINNASSFHPTPIGEATEQQWDTLIGSNLKGPFFLSQALAPLLKKSRGCIINLVDIYARKPLKAHPIYCIAKAGNAMMVKSLALELGPEIRVNGIAPGAILWPEKETNNDVQQLIIQDTPLQRSGDPVDIARTVLFLIQDADYITGQVISVDGGRNLHL